MKTLLTALAISLMIPAPAEAKQGHILRGVFCNTRAQLDETLDHLKTASTLATAVAMTNNGQVLCVHAYRIRYMVVRPVIIGRAQVNGQPLTLYEANLIAVLVGGNPRPVEPPLKTYFVPMDEVSEATEENGA